MPPFLLECRLGYPQHNTARVKMWLIGDSHEDMPILQWIQSESNQKTYEYGDPHPMQDGRWIVWFYFNAITDTHIQAGKLERPEVEIPKNTAKDRKEELMKEIGKGLTE